MSTITQLNPFISKFSNFRVFIPLRNVRLSMPQKVTVLSVTIGVVLIGLLARYLRRKRRTVYPGLFRRNGKRLAASSQGARSPNGDVRRSTSPGTRSLHRQGSVLSTVSGVGGASVGPMAAGDAGSQHLTPQQFGILGE
ncbi:hypothetical protein L798_10962 [Zootermopsis nevadensis]|uniref:Uncharacterized protein n=1 Tax=Zootermopsis nevadensis TaxID=136037 RepID=A0A067R6X4_ZOONE|nr:hypothetical protein L798_10962 [Zootermopsis nevadensis]